MSLGVTSAGKTCKKCSAKRERCHQHSISPGPFHELPNPALYEILLNLPREQLNAVCRSNKRMTEFCSNPRFRMDYNERHPVPIQVKMKGRKGAVTYTIPQYKAYYVVNNGRRKYFLAGVPDGISWLDVQNGVQYAKIISEAEAMKYKVSEWIGQEPRFH